MRYAKWIDTEMKLYLTSLSSDFDRLAEVRDHRNQYHWMYEYVLIYRIGQKQILEAHLLLTLDLIDKLEKSNGDQNVFGHSTKEIKEQSRSMADYFDLDLNISDTNDLK